MDSSFLFAEGGFYTNMVQLIPRADNVYANGLDCERRIAGRF